MNKLTDPALYVADGIADRRDWYEFDPSAWCPQASALLRTQHADLERKDALLKQALEHLAELRDMGPVDEGWQSEELMTLQEEIKQEFAK